MSADREKSRPDRHDFAAEAEAGRPGLVREFWDFVRHHKKWWLLPVFAVLLMLGLLVGLSSTAAAPFIYTLF